MAVRPSTAKVRRARGMFPRALGEATRGQSNEGHSGGYHHERTRQRRTSNDPHPVR